MPRSVVMRGSLGAGVVAWMLTIVAAGCGGSGPSGGAAGHAGASGGAAGHAGGAGGNAGASGAGVAGSTGGGGGTAGSISGDAAAGSDGGAADVPAPDAANGGADTSAPPDGPGAEAGVTLPGSPLPLCAANAQCDVDSSCVASLGPAAGAMGHCVPDGTRGGLCRLVGAACDADLTCGPAARVPGLPTPSARLCVPAAAVGDVCGTNASCVPDNVCLGATGLEKCAAPGSAGAPCRKTAPRCDTDLGCGWSGTCLPVAAHNAICNTVPIGCPEGDDCVLIDGVTAHCRSPGESGGLCRAAYPFCDAGAGCNSYNECVPAVPLGGQCGTTSTPCADDAFCSSASITNRCVMRGNDGDPCRPDGSCETGRTCAASNTCVPDANVVNEGASCATLSCRRGFQCDG